MFDGVTRHVPHRTGADFPIVSSPIPVVINALPDVVGDGSWEMVAGDRVGNVYCYSGGLNAQPNLAPNIPSLAGPSSGSINVAIEFSADTDDPELHDVYFWFDWGDGNNSGWLGPYDSREKMDTTHTWTQPNTYEVRVKAKDIAGAESGWSESLFITITDVVCGDANGDGTVNVSDAVYIINYVFVGGDAPDPLCSGDANGDETVNVSDAVYIINYVFVGGDPPVADCCPFPSSGSVTSFFGCKTFEKDADPQYDCIEWIHDGVSTLSRKHVNGGFNCCPAACIADITIDASTISIVENETFDPEYGPCYCLCLFDVDYEFVNLPPGEYTIQLSGLYLPEGQDIIEKTIDFSSEPLGSFCVYRGDWYPWG